jgi:hypothetical protein
MHKCQLFIAQHRGRLGMIAAATHRPEYSGPSTKPHDDLSGHRKRQLAGAGRHHSVRLLTDNAFRGKLRACQGASTSDPAALLTGASLQTKPARLL